VSVHERRADVLREARRRDSVTKRARVLQALTELENAGEPISVAALARRAGVSTWLVYSEGVREHLEATRARQTAQPTVDRRSGRSPSTASLRTDLQLARAEITTLRAERDQLRNGMRQQLGRDLDAMSSAGLSTRVEELARRNQQLAEQNQYLEGENAALAGRVAELEADVAAARTSLRRMIRDQNSPEHATDSPPHR
jgi:chromosome segregation ATPase